MPYRSSPLNPKARKVGKQPSREEVTIAVSNAWTNANQSKDGLQEVDIGGVSYTVHDTDQINKVVAAVLNRLNSHPS